MLIFGSVFFGLIILQASLEILRRFLCNQIIIDENSITTFKIEEYKMVHQLLAKYNHGNGDPEIKNLVL